MIKKLICILCVLSTAFLFSCRKAEQSATEENTGESQTEFVSENGTELMSTQIDGETDESMNETQVAPGEKNKFKLTNIRKNGLTQKQYEAYKLIVSAMDSGKTEIKADLTDEADSYNKVKSALWSGYPLYALVQDMHYSHSTKILSVKYTKSGAELANAIDGFYDKVGTILTKDVLLKDSFSKTLLIYDYVSGGTPSGDNAATVYDFLMNGKGTDIQFSMAHEYLLGLAGVDCNHVSGEVGEKQVSLTQVKIGNNFYYMSPYKEAADNSGKKLKYFGMTDERAKSATGAEEFFSINNEYEQVKVPACSDGTFAFTASLESWTLDTDKKELTYKTTGNSYTYKY